MAKKKVTKKTDDEAALPKFEGFHPLAGGLAGFKSKLDADKKKEDEARAAAAARGKPLPPARAVPAPSYAPSTKQGSHASHASDRSTDFRGSPTTAAARQAEDEHSFHRMMSGVVQLDQGARGRVPRTAEVQPGAQKLKAHEIQARAQVEAEKAIAHLHALVEGGSRFEVSDDGRRVEGWRDGTPPDFMRSLRRGQLPIDARLDLHGMHAAEAQEKLSSFLQAMRARNERCVLVIHGKGERVPGSGVLRGEIAAWLSQGRAREHVAAFATAQDDDGGEGAVYVALRR